MSARRFVPGLAWLALVVGAGGCDINHSSLSPADAGSYESDSACVVDAGLDVDPLMTCSPSGCIPFDNSVVPPNVPRL